MACRSFFVPLPKGASNLVGGVEFRRNPANTQYQLRVNLRADGGGTTSSGWVDISDNPHSIEIDWQAATAPAANNGQLAWWLDGTAQTSVTGVDNDLSRVDRIRLGAVSGLDAGTSGTEYFDGFESRKTTAIGVVNDVTSLTYTYDGLYRLGNANYSNSNVFTYTYDAVGNRLTEQINGGSVVNSTYDIANRLTSVGAQTYTWDNNGNLLNDG